MEEKGKRSMTRFKINGFEVRAKRWYKAGDHPHVLRFEWPGNTCPVCGKEYVGHGFVGGIINGRIVCPGDWVAEHPNGTVRAWTDEEFKDAVPVIDGEVH